jgi:hypothetical protein
MGVAPVGGTFVRLPRETEISPPVRGGFTQTESTSEPTLTRRSLSWVQKRLREYYGSNFYKQPTRGIFHHHPDETYDLLEKEVFLQLAKTYQPWIVSSDEERFDCDEYAMGLRWMFLTGGFGEFPATNMVGQAHNFAGKHVYNVVICADGEIVEWEPQSNVLAVESRAPQKYYDFENGILYL